MSPTIPETKSRLAVALAVAFTVTLAACGGGGGGSSDAGATTTTTTDTTGSPPRVPETGFMAGTPNASPLRDAYTGTRAAISIANAATKTVFIYMPGVTDPKLPQDCSANLPQALDGVRDDTHLVYFLCSDVVNTRPESRYYGDFIDGRVPQFKAIVAELISAGVAKKNIYLSGYSAGGWSALMTASSMNPADFGGTVVFAAAMAGTASTRTTDMADARAADIDALKSGQTLHALVFSYDDDTYENSTAISFLKTSFPTTVTQVTGNYGQGHSTPFGSWSRSTEIQAIRDFLPH